MVRALGRVRGDGATVQRRRQTRTRLRRTAFRHEVEEETTTIVAAPAAGTQTRAALWRMKIQTLPTSRQDSAVLSIVDRSGVKYGGTATCVCPWI